MRLARGAERRPAAIQVHHLARRAGRCARPPGGDPAWVTRLGRVRFDAAVRRQVARWDAVNPWQKIIDGVFAACADPAGVTELRHGALERVGMLMADWRDTQARLADTEQRMVTVLGDLGLTELVTSITGLSAVGAASILAETGDPRRFTSGRALVQPVAQSRAGGAGWGSWNAARAVRLGSWAFLSAGRLAAGV